MALGIPRNLPGVGASVRHPQRVQPPHPSPAQPLPMCCVAPVGRLGAKPLTDSAWHQVSRLQAPWAPGALGV